MHKNISTRLMITSSWTLSKTKIPITVVKAQMPSNPNQKSCMRDNKALCIISNPSVNSNGSYSLEMLNSGQNWWFFVLCDLEIWQMTLKINRTPLLYYFMLCAAYQSHQWIQTGVTVRKRSIWVKISDIFARMTPEFDGWPWKTIGHLFYATSSFVHHFKVIDEFKLKLQSWNSQFGSKSVIFCPVWPWNLIDDLEKQGKSEGFESCDQPIVRKRPIWVKISDVLSRVTLKFDGWPWKTIGHLSFAVSSFVQHFIAIGEFKLELLSGNAQFGSNSTIFRAVWPWNLTYDLEKQ